MMGRNGEYVEEGKGWQPIWIIVTEPATQPYLTPAPLIQIPVADTNSFTHPAKLFWNFWPSKKKFVCSKTKRRFYKGLKVKMSK